MNLTTEQIAEIVEQNKGLIVSFASKYANKFGPKRSEMMDDFIQDATIALIERLRSTDSVEDALKFHREALHEMSLDVLSYQTLSVPRRTGKMRHITSNMPSCTNIDDLLESVDINSTDALDSLVERTAYENFYDELPEKDQHILNLRGNGLSIKEIANEIGESYFNVRYRMNRCRDQYMAQCNE